MCWLWRGMVSATAMLPSSRQEGFEGLDGSCAVGCLAKGVASEDAIRTSAPASAPHRILSRSCKSPWHRIGRESSGNRAAKLFQGCFILLALHAGVDTAFGDATNRFPDQQSSTSVEVEDAGGGAEWGRGRRCDRESSLPVLPPG